MGKPDAAGAAISDGDRPAALNLARIIESHDAATLALISRNQTLTYGALNDLVARLRGALAAQGVGDGDRVALIAPNGIPFVVTFLAALGLGAVAVPLNPASPSIELGHQVRTVDAQVVLVGRGAATNWRGVDRQQVISVTTVISVEPGAIEGALSWDELIAAEPGPAVVDVDPDHLAVLMFTSGTASSPRVAMLTHDNLLANQEQVSRSASAAGAGDIVYGVLPVYHIFGLNVMLGVSLAAGATVLLVQRFDPETAIESIMSRKVSVLPGVPAMWAAFAHFDEAPADAFATVRRATSGAAKLPVSVAERIEERFGLRVAEGYGLTEASPVVTTSAGLAPRFGSVGKVLQGIEVRVVGDDDEDVLVGDAGEILVRGRNVFAGYLGDEVATNRVLTPEGWLRTGDVAMVDGDGWLYLVDRAKDLIIVSGFNVFPGEVEDVLTGHPDVAEAGVVGVPHPHTGEAVKAYVVAVPGGSVDEEGLIEYTRDHLARYKCPSKVIFVEELPRNAAGKLVRRHLDNLLPS